MVSKRIEEQAELHTSGVNTREEKQKAIRDIFMTVGKAGKPGEHIRCIVSVGMLTEGWDAHNVTHVFGYRRFGSLLLCEQVTGRALRRTSFSGDDRRQIPEYANVFGVPYTFARGGDVEPPKPPTQPWVVESLPDREEFRIEFPDVVGYAQSGDVIRFRLDPDKVADYSVPERDVPDDTEIGGPVGEGDRLLSDFRPRTACWHTAARVAPLLESSGKHKRITFQDSLQAVNEWCTHPAVDCDDPLDIPFDEVAPERIAEACVVVNNGESGRILPVFSDMRDQGQNRFSSTEAIHFRTTLKHRYVAKKSELNAAACHTKEEVQVAFILDEHEKIQAWARNFRLGWTVPWFDNIAQVWRRTEPDFIARAVTPEDSRPLHLLIEFKGMRQGEPEEEAKRLYLENWWAPAISEWKQDGENYGDWRVVWIEDIRHATRLINKACN